MPATLKKPESKTLAKPAPLKLKTWKEVREYYAAHLTPVSVSANGRAVYRSEDIIRLNVLLPDEN